MTHKERIDKALANQPVDRLPCAEMFWAETIKKYTEQGRLKPGEDLFGHFDMSWRRCGGLVTIADLERGDTVLEEVNDTRLYKDGNGATLRAWKDGTGTPEHVAFDVTDREGWERLIKPHLLALDERRIPFEAYRSGRSAAADEGRAFLWSGLAPFELMFRVCGHENLLVGMALDPDWVKDMAMTYADFTVRHIEALFRKEGIPDHFWFFEDMGMKERPFMSPAMYEDILQPTHARLFAFAHRLGCKVVVHSCGMVEKLVPGLVDAGMDCLQAMEVKAGMDMPRLAKTYGGRLAFCGNIDVRVLCSNDRRRIDEELAHKIPPVLEAGSGYILHSDHSIPPEVEYDTVRYFLERGRQGTGSDAGIGGR